MVTKKTIKVPLYPCKLEVIIYDDEKEISEDYPSAKGAGAFYYAWDDGYFLIGVKSKYGVEAITHEAEHVKNRIFNFIGQTPNGCNDEVDSYLLGWIAKQVTNVYYKHKDGNREETEDSKKDN